MPIALKQLLKWKKVESDETSEDSLSWALFQKNHPNWRALKISYAEIKRATNNFSPELVIGENGYRKIYKGILLNGLKVAVKRIDPDRRLGIRMFRIRMFRAEIMVSSQISHPNIVSLIGYCDERSEMILVHEFMENGTLADHLNFSAVKNSVGSSLRSKLSWEQRLQICINTAEALHYLHTGSDERIVHGDVKPHNVLLDENFVAKVADFGLSKSGPFGVDEYYRVYNTNIKGIPTIVGTPGYTDEEYIWTSQLTEKSDVYSFGVVLVEVLCARRRYDLIVYQEDNWGPVGWEMVWQRRGHLKDWIDPVLVGSIGLESLRVFCETAEKCVRKNRNERPTMREVLWNLELSLELQEITALGGSRPEEYSKNNACLELLLRAIYHIPSQSPAQSDSFEVVAEGNLPSESDVHAMLTEVFSPMHEGR